MFEEVVDSFSDNAIIRVIGVGGAGGNALEHMVTSEIEGVDFICTNTDSQALGRSTAQTVLQIGAQTTRGRGAGAIPTVGRDSALEDREAIREAIEGTEMLFITAGMGGGTGTGAAPVVAEVAKEMGILTVAVVTKPFEMEGRKRMTIAQEGIEELSQNVDSIITIPNEKLMTVFGEDMSLQDAFREADGVLHGAVQGIAELITREGMVNVDFADVKTVMSEMGMAMMGTGHATGENRAAEAADKALHSPLLDDIDLRGARGVLVNITSGYDLNMGQYKAVGSAVHQYASEEATIVIGTAFDPEMEGEIRVTVVATGLDSAQSAEQEQPVKVKPALVEVEPLQRTGTDGYMPNRPQPTNTDFDRPTFQRHETPAAAGMGAGTAPVNASSGLDEEYLDIPAFLRTQAN